MRVEQRDVGAGPRREVNVGIAGEFDRPRVDHDEFRPAQHRLLDARADDGMVLGRVAPQTRMVRARSMSSKEFVAAPVPSIGAQCRRRSARGRRARSSRRCWCRAPRARTSARDSSPRSSRAPSRARHAAPGRARPRSGPNSPATYAVASSQDTSSQPSARRIIGLVTRSGAPDELERVAALHAEMALVHGRVEHGRTVVMRPLRVPTSISQPTPQ